MKRARLPNDSGDDTLRLHVAATKQVASYVRRLVVEENLDVNLRNRHGSTPLHNVCRVGYDRMDIIPFLVDKGAEVNAKDNEKKTPLMWSCTNGLVDEAKFLVETGGAQVNTKDKNGKTPLHFVCQMDDEDRSLEIARCLVEHGAQINAVTQHGETALHVACFTGHLNLCVFLIQRGAQVQARNKYGMAPFHFACCHSHLNIAELLIEQGVDPYETMDAWDNNGMTALHAVCRKGDWRVVAFLLNRGANIQGETKDGSTPLDIAAKNNHPDSVFLLLRTSPWLVVNG